MRGNSATDRHRGLLVAAVMLLFAGLLMATQTGCLLGDEDTEQQHPADCVCPDCPDACPVQPTVTPDVRPCPCPDGRCPCPNRSTESTEARECNRNQFVVRTGELRCRHCNRSMVGEEAVTVWLDGQPITAYCRQCGSKMPLWTREKIINEAVECGRLARH